MMDDNTGDLEVMRIDRQLRKETTGSKYVRNGDSGMYKRILEALIVASIVALIAAVWNLTQTVTLLQASQDSHRRDIDRIERRQDALEGKITRGETNALDQQ